MTRAVLRRVLAPPARRPPGTPVLRWFARSALVTAVLLAILVGTCPAVVESSIRPVPAGLRLTSATTSTMTLSWRGVSGSAAYRVAYSTSPTMAEPTTVEFTDNSGTIDGLQSGRRYWVRVAVADKKGKTLSGYTQPDYPSARTLYPGGYAFLAPRKVTVVRTRLTSLELDWARVKGAPGYRLQVARTRAMVAPRTLWFDSDAGVVGHLKPARRYFVTVSVAPKDETSGALSDTTVARVAETKTDVPKSYDLRVASYNISGSLNDTRRNAPWSVRKSYVVRQLLGLAPADQLAPPPDAIALQEANSSRRLPNGVDQYHDTINGLNASAPATAHYSAIGGNSNATHLVWNDKTLTLVKSGVLYFRAQELRQDGARMSPWAIFEIKRTGARFFVLSAHLESVSERIRRAQWYELIDRVPALSEGYPAVLGGDFNSPRKARNNPTAATMLGRMAAAGFGDTLGQDGSGMVYASSSRARDVVHGNFNSLNRFNRRLGAYPSSNQIGQDIDYLFASRALKVLTWEMVIDVAGTTLRGVVPSDHNMIRSTIALPTPTS